MKGLEGWKRGEIVIDTDSYRAGGSVLKVSANQFVPLSCAITHQTA